MNDPSDTAEVQLAAVPKLLPPPEMSRGIQHVAARKVQGRLLAGLEQRGDRILVSTFACRRREIIAVRGTPPRLVGCMVLHDSSDLKVNWSGKATARGAAR